MNECPSADFYTAISGYVEEFLTKIDYIDENHAKRVSKLLSFAQSEFRKFRITQTRG